RPCRGRRLLRRERRAIGEVEEQGQAHPGAGAGLEHVQRVLARTPERVAPRWNAGVDRLELGCGYGRDTCAQPLDAVRGHRLYWIDACPRRVRVVPRCLREPVVRGRTD